MSGKSLLPGSYIRTEFPIVPGTGRLFDGAQSRRNTIPLSRDYRDGSAEESSGQAAIRQHFLQESLQETS